MVVFHGEALKLTINRWGETAVFIMTTIDVKSASYRIAYFISPHGYGHAARASAVMQALHELDSKIRFEIFTKVPRWFFEQSLVGAFGYHSLLTDIGLAQKTPLLEDLPETIRRLEKLLPFEASHMAELAHLLHRLECQLVICDIAAMGIAVAVTWMAKDRA